MTAKPPAPDFNQYGLRDDNVHADEETYANRKGGEQPGVGPADTVDASGHRRGKIQERPAQKPSSRMGRADIGETDDRQR